MKVSGLSVKLFISLCKYFATLNIIMTLRRTQELRAVVQHCARACGTEKTVYHHHRVSVEGLDQTVDEQCRRWRRREKRRQKWRQERRQEWRQKRWQRVEMIVRRALTAGVSVVISVARRAPIVV